jgi:hypothetical protein
MNTHAFAAAGAFAVLALGCAETPHRELTGMSFFVTSFGTGKGADLGGLAGADRHCQMLGAAVGQGGKTWRAYLSTSGGAYAGVNARDRIGTGPWENAKGVVIASNVDELHGNNNLSKETALTEGGARVSGRGDKPNMHDILTGSQPDGRAIVDEPAKTTCSNWTSSGEGAAMVGHHDRLGLRDDDASRSWNSSHPSRGCSLPELNKSGGAGLFYCFAVR